MVEDYKVNQCPSPKNGVLQCSNDANEEVTPTITKFRVVGHSTLNANFGVAQKKNGPKVNLLLVN
jgi:hypothetical protein